MTLQEMVYHNINLYDDKNQDLPKRGELYRLTSTIKGTVTIVNTREDLQTDYSGMVGYVIARREEDQLCLVYIPVTMIHGMLIAFPNDDVKEEI